MSQIPPVPPPPGFDPPPPLASPPPPRAGGPVHRGAQPPSNKPSVFLLLLGLAGLGVGGYALWYGLHRTYIDDEAVLHGSIIGGLGLLFFCLWLRKAVNPVAAAAALVLVVSGAAGMGYFSLQNEQFAAAENAVQEQLFASMSTICTINEGLPEAPGYEQGSASTAMFYNRRSDGGEWYPSRYGISEQYQPSAATELNIVICAATEARFVQSCPYSTSAGDRTLTREQYVKTITVRDARTAQVLETRTMEGTMPPECPANRTFDEYEYMASSYGSLPSDSDLIELIGSWLDGSAAPGLAGGTAPTHESPTQPASTPTGVNTAAGVKPGDEPANGKP